MNTTQLSDVAHAYCTRLIDLGYKPTQTTDAKTSSERLNHALWMTMEIQKFIMEDKIEKAHRWLGFVQAILWIDLGVSIEEMKKDNRSGG